MDQEETEARIILVPQYASLALALPTKPALCRWESSALFSVSFAHILLVVVALGRQHLWLLIRKVLLPFHLSAMPASTDFAAFLVPLNRNEVSL